MSGISPTGSGKSGPQFDDDQSRIVDDADLESRAQGVADQVLTGAQTLPNVPSLTGSDDFFVHKTQYDQRFQDLCSKIKSMDSRSEITLTDDKEANCEILLQKGLDHILTLIPMPSSPQDEEKLSSMEKALVNHILLFREFSENPSPCYEIGEAFNAKTLITLLKAIINHSSKKYFEIYKPLDVILGVDELLLTFKQTSEVKSNRSRSSSFEQGKSSSEGSEQSSNEQLEKEAEAYRTKYESATKTKDNKHGVSGNATAATTAVTNLFKKTEVVILGEGSHQEYALDAMIIDPKLPGSLAQLGVKIVLAEHIYPEHADKLLEVNCSDLVKHLTEVAFGSYGKAFNYLHFLRACRSNGIDVIAADTKKIYRPSGVNKNTYGQTDRLESLNSNIVKLYDSHKNKGKMLIILGAAHSNHLNAAESRAKMGVNKPSYLTPGVTDVIPDAQELIVVTQKQEGQTGDMLPLHSIREGMVFHVEI